VYDVISSYNGASEPKSSMTSRSLVVPIGQCYVWLSLLDGGTWSEVAVYSCRLE